MRGSLPGRWLTAHLPFGDMVGTCRGEVVPDAAPLDRSRAYSLGLLIAGVQPGPFTLEIAWLKAHAHSARAGAARIRAVHSRTFARIRFGAEYLADNLQMLPQSRGLPEPQDEIVKIAQRTLSIVGFQEDIIQSVAGSSELEASIS